MTTHEDPRIEIARCLAHRLSDDPAAEVLGLNRLSGGANQETWAFTLRDLAGETPLILRRTPSGRDHVGSGISLNLEAALVRRAHESGIKAPEVRYVLQPEDQLSTGFVMGRVEGETLPQKMFRDPAFEKALQGLAFECGAQLAAIHRLNVSDIPDVPVSPAKMQLEAYRALYDDFGDPHPVFELAFKWLEDHMPDAAPETLVHGDFRNGNLMVSPEGLAAVLDWELAHLGDPMEDLGWICVNSWRFNRPENPVGGFGQLKDLYAGYESAGGNLRAQDVHYWMVFGTMKWGIMCTRMVDTFRTGADRTVERAAIGRRASETEIDLLNLLIEE
ncbi:MAG: phosphotransferase family protein [Alphaproteobacteria bacterium]|nr:MAG: phosphotransferase family protein [Alphaproteobacteria bacterium]